MENEYRKLVPNGPFCYSRNGTLCPFWSKVNTKPEQLSGYCRLLEIGDWMEDTLGELWRQVKECDINIEGG